MLHSTENMLSYDTSISFLKQIRTHHFEILFQGEQMIESEKLELEKKEIKELIRDKEENLNNIERNRDIVMKWKDGINLVIFACENQENIHYAMPVRTMLYDGLSYTEQIRQLRN